MLHPDFIKRVGEGIPITLASIATIGFDPLFSVAQFASHLAQIASYLDVAIKSKNKDMKQILSTTAFPSLIRDITEPVIYGATIK